VVLFLNAALDVLIARNAHRTHPESQAVDRQADRCGEERCVAMLRRLNGECAE
jgi:hypothetical protein